MAKSSVDVCVATVRLDSDGGIAALRAGAAGISELFLSSHLAL